MGESIVVIVLIGLVVLVAMWAVAIYNKLVALRQRVAEAWSGIDVQLKRRSNLIPNLIATIEGYVGHEKSTLEEVTAMRTKAENAEGVAERADAESKLSGAMMNLFAVAENYPDLKASTNFLDLQDELSALEDQIQMARRYYNGSVRDFNTLIETFPSNLIANRFAFRQAVYFEIENAAERALPKVAFGET
jgi:LemA protein